LGSAIADVQRHASDFFRPLELATIQSLLPNARTAIVTFCVTDQSSLGFVISKAQAETVRLVDVPNFTQEDLMQLLFATDAQGRIRGGWVGGYLRF
jgi:hypothetical protein